MGTMLLGGNMNNDNFDNIERLDIDCTIADEYYTSRAYCYKSSHGTFVYFDDYKRLLDSYKELKYRIESLEK